MKPGSRALLAFSAAWLLGACASGAVDAPEAPAASEPRAPLPVLLRLPRWVQPAALDLAASADLCHAVAAAERGDDDAAAVRLRAVRETGSHGPEVTALHAWTLRAAAGAAAAEAVAREGLERHGSGSPSLHYALAVVLEDDGRPAAALDSYRQVLAAAPNDPVLLRACARTAFAAGLPRAALPHLELLASAAPADPDLLAGLAEAVHADAQATGSEDRRARARALCQELALLDPQHGAAHRMLGESLAASGEAEAAVAALRRALEIEPGSAPAGLLLARLLHERGRRGDAVTVLRDLLRQPLAPETVTDVRRQLEILEQS